MENRRAFLRSISGSLVLAPLHSGLAPVFAADATPGRDREPLGWKPHLLKRGDGRGGWTLKPAEYQFLHRNTGRYVFPFGVVQMDNGEVALIASWNDGSSDKAVLAEKPVIAFSRDAGSSWTEFQAIDGAAGRPMMLTYLGNGRLMFQTDLVKPIMQYFSSDYGRTWPERKQFQTAADGEPFAVEGNPLVERDDKGGATRVAEIGWKYEKGAKWPNDPATGMLRWSSDGARTWKDETIPTVWRWKEQANGKTYMRGISEGSLVRAVNGWLVAALRTDIPARYLDVPNEDSLEGTGISISKDDGKTWSPIQILYDAGRHHAHLLRLRNGDIVMTLIVRDDIRNGKLASYRRGCEAILSHNNGVSWDVAHKYVLDDYEFMDGHKWYNGECGHLYSALLDDGHILTCFAKYLTKGASLIRWKPSVR